MPTMVTQYIARQPIFDAEKGDDTIKGGAGNDTAVYKGTFADSSTVNVYDPIYRGAISWAPYGAGSGKSNRIRRNRSC